MKKCCNRLRLRPGVGVGYSTWKFTMKIYRLRLVTTPTPVKTTDSGRLRLRLRLRHRSPVQDSPYSAHAQPIFGTPQIELKLTPRVDHHTSSPPLEAFGVTTNGLTYRGQQRSGVKFCTAVCGHPMRAGAPKKAPNDLPGPVLLFHYRVDLSKSPFDLRLFAGLAGNTFAQAVSPI